MGVIKEPVITKFSDENLRPVAEQLLAMRVILENWKAKWTSQVVPIAGNATNTDTIDDGRAAEGVSQLTVKNWKDLEAIVTLLNNVLQASGVLETITLPTVRDIKSIM